MTTLLTFLGLVMPKLGPVLMRLPELASLFRSAFTRVGGDESEFDAILAANQKDIDRLADPDSFRHAPPKKD